MDMRIKDIIILIESIMKFEYVKMSIYHIKTKSPSQLMCLNYFVLFVEFSKEVDHMVFSNLKHSIFRIYILHMIYQYSDMI